MQEALFIRRSRPASQRLYPARYREGYGNFAVLTALFGKRVILTSNSRLPLNARIPTTNATDSSRRLITG
jgi:hypothetical protein